VRRKNRRNGRSPAAPLVAIANWRDWLCRGTNRGRGAAERSVKLVEGEVQFEHIDPLFADHAEQWIMGLLVDQRM
jgi:hypothetical protein